MSSRTRIRSGSCCAASIIRIRLANGAGVAVRRARRRPRRRPITADTDTKTPKRRPKTALSGSYYRYLPKHTANTPRETGPERAKRPLPNESGGAAAGPEARELAVASPTSPQTQPLRLPEPQRTRLPRRLPAWKRQRVRCAQPPWTRSARGRARSVSSGRCRPRGSPA